MTKKRSATCVYCGASPSTAKFNREHVVPEAFGMFEDNFVLHGVVCRKCNSYFSGELEIPLARQTYEGLSRYESGIALPDEKKRIGHSRRLRAVLEGTDFDGAAIEWCRDPDTSKLAARPARQIGIAQVEHGPVSWFVPSELPSRDAIHSLGFTLPVTLWFLGCHPEEVRGLLIERGWPASYIPVTAEEVGLGPYAIPGATLPLRVSGTIDDVVLRAIAKIAFNYLIYHFEGVARMDQLAGIRHYIRYGDNPFRRSFVSVSKGSSFGNVPPEVRLEAHMVAIDWDWRRKRLVGNVSLFDWAKYSLAFGDGFAIPMAHVRSAHIFNPHARAIAPLTRRRQPTIDLSKHIRRTAADDDSD